MTVASGTRLGRYEIRSPLGAGGMGEVYLAQDTKLERIIALKILPADVAADQKRMGRFTREAKAASALNHPNIITIHEIEQVDSTHFIATEFIEGETLRASLLRARAPLRESLDVAVQAASALSAAHEAGIVHRDIKPDNIMIRPDGLVKVLDFGLAKLSEKTAPRPVDTEALTEAAAVRTEPGVVMGTVNYMSPEQARGQEVDARTDIFSLGVVVYEMLTGESPFAGGTASDRVAAILKTEPAPLKDFNQEVPAELDRIVSKTLAKDREERYQTAKDLLVDLRRVKKQLEVQAEIERTASPDRAEGERATQILAARPTSSAEYVAGEIRKHKLGVIVALSLLLLAAAVGYRLFSQRSSNETQIEAIAVLPFENASGNPDNEYLSDGMTETLIGSLSQLPKLSVKARSSVFRYKGRESDLRKVAGELNVQAVLTGRVTQRGEDLTLYLSLVDAANENNLWSKQYNRKLTNLVALQNEIARDVSENLKTKLSGADEQKLTKNYTDNAEAYQLYLKGRFQTLKVSPPEILKGVSYLQEAIQIDPDYALAHVGLADAYRALALGGEQPPNEYFPKAKTAANRAIEIDGTLAEAHAVLGFIIYWYDWDWAEAGEHAKRALELNPNNADVHFAYGQFLSTLGRFDDGLPELKRSRELEPLNLRNNSLEAQFLSNAGRRDESFAAFRKIFEIDPNYWFAHTLIAIAYINEKMYTEAAASARKARELNIYSTRAIALEGYALAKSGRQTEARAALQELLQLSKQRYVPPTNIATVYCGLNETDEAVAWLQRAYGDKDPRIVFLKIDRLWDDLRGEPRFQELLRRMNFPP